VYIRNVLYNTKIAATFLRKKSGNLKKVKNEEGRKLTEDLTRLMRENKDGASVHNNNNIYSISE
jgi:hypothetical protein